MGWGVEGGGGVSSSFTYEHWQNTCITYNFSLLFMCHTLHLSLSSCHMYTLCLPFQGCESGGVWISHFITLHCFYTPLLGDKWHFHSFLLFFFFFYPRSFPLLYQFLPFLLSCYFNEVLLGKFKWEFSWRCSSIKLTCCSRNRSILMPSPANLVNYKFFVVLLTQQISIQLHKFSVKYVNSLLPI